MADDDCKDIEDIIPNQTARQQIEREIEQAIEGHFTASSAALNAVSVFLDPGNDTNRRNQSETAFKNWLITFAGVPIDEKRFDKGFSVPDIASRRNLPKPNANEFYEIKPDSHNGRRDCARKVIDVANFLHELRLTFMPGEDYQRVPNQELRWSTTAGGVEIEVVLKWRVADVGQILYKVCGHAKRKQEVREPVKEGLIAAMILLIFAIALAAIFRGQNGGIRAPGFGPAPTFT